MAVAGGKASLFNREASESPEGGSRSPFGSLGVELVKAIVIALGVYLATSLAQRPESTDTKLADLDKREALTEQAISQMKEDISIIKRAVTRRRDTGE